jgi:hypothetical protein
MSHLLVSEAEPLPSASQEPVSGHSSASLLEFPETMGLEQIALFP